MLLIIKSTKGSCCCCCKIIQKKRLQIDQFFCETRLENRNGLRNVDHRIGNVGHWLRIIHADRRLSAAAAPDEFVSEYSVPGIITQYQRLSLSTKDYYSVPGIITQYQGFIRISIFFSIRLVEPVDRVSDISACFSNLDHIHCLLLMFCSPFARQRVPMLWMQVNCKS